MIIDAIHLYTTEYASSTKIAELSLTRADLTQPYILQAAAGLDAGEFTPKFFGTSDAGTLRYYSVGTKDREIVLRIRLNPQGAGVTYSSLRDAIYKGISSSYLSKVELRFMLSTTEKARVTGYVTRLESALFVDYPEVQITLVCPDPYFKDPATTTFTGLDKVNPVFSDTESTAPHGFTMNLTFASAVSANVSRIVFSKSPYWYFTIIGVNLIASATDTLTMVSVENQKDLYITRSGTKISILDKIAPGSTWPILFPGSTTFNIAMDQPTGTALASTAWAFGTVSHNKTYWGI